MNERNGFVGRSAVVRYASRLGRDPEVVGSTSIAEGLSIQSSVVEYEGVTIDLLDMSSHAHTGTFKALLAALAVNDAVEKQLRGFVTVSSGNTAEAMAAYAVPRGIECFLFVPAVSHYKLNRKWLAAPGVHLFQLDVPEPELKSIAARFSESTGLPLLPTVAHQIDSNKVRAFFLADQHQAGLPQYDWTVQSLSGGYGPIGFYEGVRELVLEGQWPGDQVPSLLGVQQAANCPLVPDNQKPTSSVQPVLLEPTLYATRPKHAEDLCRVLHDFGGQVLAVNDADYLLCERELVDLLRENGLECGRSLFAPGQPVVERSGLMAIVGTQQAIRQGVIGAGSRVLVNFTGGCCPDLTAAVTPEFALKAGDPIETFHTAVARYESVAAADATQ